MGDQHMWTAVFSLIGAAYIKYALVFNAMRTDYEANVFPEIYNVEAVFLGLTLIGAGGGHFLGYFHILFRLHHFLQHNEATTSIAPCKYCLHFIGVMICLLPGFIGILLSFVSILTDLLFTGIYTLLRQRMEAVI